MKRLALLLCLLSAPVIVGCASTPRTLQYSGTPAPPAPAFNPAMDAPHTTGQPGHLQKPVRRTNEKEFPRGREQYATGSQLREPGVWAVHGEDDKPANDNTEPEWRARVLALSGTPKGIPADVWAWCFADNQAAWKKLREVMKEAAAVSREHGECLKLHLNSACIDTFMHRALDKDRKLEAKYNMPAFEASTRERLLQLCADFAPNENNETALHRALREGYKRWYKAGEDWEYR